LSVGDSTAALGSTCDWQRGVALVGDSNGAVHGLSVGGPHALEFAWNLAELLATFTAVFNASELDAGVLEFDMTVVGAVFYSSATMLTLLGKGSQRE
jgi:hypothetical protein